MLKYFGRAVSVGSKPLQGQASKTLGTATTASTMHRLSEAPKRPVLQAHAELSGDASRVLAFLQMHSSNASKQSHDEMSCTPAANPALYQHSFPERDTLHIGDRRYRNAGQTLQMMGLQNVANFSTQHQWLQARATMDMNMNPMIRARSGIPAAHNACGVNA